MTRVSVFLSTALLAAFLGWAAENGAQAQTSPSPGSVQISQASSAGSSLGKKELALASGQAPAPSPTTVDRSKHLEKSDEASANLATEAPLPQTSTILPLLGFIGLGSLVVGLFARR
jgi:hypothetical protein